MPCTGARLSPLPHSGALRSSRRAGALDRRETVGSAAENLSTGRTNGQKFFFFRIRNMLYARAVDWVPTPDNDDMRGVFQGSVGSMEGQRADTR